jgi:hypothetical protein
MAVMAWISAMRVVRDSARSLSLDRYYEHKPFGFFVINAGVPPHRNDGDGRDSHCLAVGAATGRALLSDVIFADVSVADVS